MKHQTTRRVLLLIAIAIVFARAGQAQPDWQRVFQIPSSTMSCAYFFNAQEGVIGTGNYMGGAIATIYLTTNGGTSWTRSELPSSAIVGEVTDIFFRDSLNGWATLTEATPTGWSGIYRTTDRGRTWKLIHQAGFPVGVRETSRGVFYTDRDILPGVNLSTDGGRSWRSIFDLSSCLGIDFYDDDNGFATSQAYSSPPAHITTTDGGLTWRYVLTNAEAWTVLADPVAQSFLLSSEQNNGGTGSMSGLITASSASATEQYIHFDPPFALTGGIAANRGPASCSRYTYAQIRHVAGSLQPGFLRTTDRGATWTQVNGPCNRADTRFAVTGQGAVIFAGDSIGGVWRTTNGGGKGLSPSVLPNVRAVATTASTRARICDSTRLVFRLNYLGCDSLTIAGIEVLNDTMHELRNIAGLSQALGGTRADSLVLEFTPRTARLWYAELRISIRQSDGYTEDTVLRQLMIGTQQAAGSLAFLGAGSPATLDFDSVALCTSSARRLTIASTSCYDLPVTGVSVTGPFTLRSSFSPFVLSLDAERSFLVEYTPGSAAIESGLLVFRHAQGTDTLRLLGRGYSGGKKLSFGAAAVAASECDSAHVTLDLFNLTCSTLKFLSATGATHVSVAVAKPDTIASGGSLPIDIGFVPSSAGSGRDTVTLSFDINGERWDTTIVVTWSASEGKGSLALTASSIDLGTVSPCSSGISDTIVISNTGCGALTIAGQLLDTSQSFRLERLPSSLAQGESDTVIVHFLPTREGARFRATLTVRTNAGDTTIEFIATSATGPGALAIAAAEISPNLLCESSSFFVSIRNATCDSLYLVSEELLAGQDFAIVNNVQQPLARDRDARIPLLFAPIAEGARADKLVLHFRRGSDNSQFDTTISLSGLGLRGNELRVGVAPVILHARASTEVLVPLFVSGTSSVPVRTLHLTIAMNSDLLTPVGIVAGRGAFGSASVRTLDLFGPDSARITLDLSSPMTVAPGELVVLRCHTFIATRLVTTIRVADAYFEEARTRAECVPTSRSDSSAYFTLDLECGDETISQTMATGQVMIERLSPNPTHGTLHVRVRNSATEATNGTIEVIDEDGATLSATTFAIAAQSAHDVTLQVTGHEGARFIRIRTPDRISPMWRVVLQK